MEPRPGGVWLQAEPWADEEQGDHPVWKTRWQEMQQWMEAVVDTPGRKKGMEHGHAPRGPG